jgi:hypothetical protein
LKSNLARTAVRSHSRTDRNARRTCLGALAAVQNPAHPYCAIASREASLQRGRPTPVGVEECSQGSARADPWNGRPLSRSSRAPAREDGRRMAQGSPSFLEPKSPPPSRQASLQRGRPTPIGVEECSQGSAKADPWKGRTLSPGRAGRQPARMAGEGGHVGRSPMDELLMTATTEPGPQPPRLASARPADPGRGRRV